MLPHFIPISPQLPWKSSDQCKTQSPSSLLQSPWAYSVCSCTRSHCNLRHVIVGFRCSHLSKGEGTDFEISDVAGIFGIPSWSLLHLGLSATPFPSFCAHVQWNTLHQTETQAFCLARIIVFTHVKGCLRAATSKTEFLALSVSAVHSFPLVDSHATHH